MYISTEEPLPPVEESPREGKKSKKTKGKEEKEKKTKKPPEKTEEELLAEAKEAARKEEEQKRKAMQLEMWEGYLKNLDNIIEELMLDAVRVNQSFLLIEMSEPQNAPLLELIMELHEPNIVYIPSVDMDDPVSFLVFMEGKHSI